MKRDTSKNEVESGMLTPLKAIRAKCFECCSNNKAAVRGCSITECPLFSYRLGHNPARRGIGGGLGNFKRSFSHSSGQFSEKVAL